MSASAPVSKVTEGAAERTERFCTYAPKAEYTPAVSVKLRDREGASRSLTSLSAVFTGPVDTVPPSP